MIYKGVDNMLILIGASASGKTEVAKYLMHKYHLNKIITYTTRQKRINEINGVDYNFISLEEFALLKEQDFFVETTYYNQNYYGTAKKDIQDDKCIILDPNGFQSFLALHDPKIISFYLDSDEEIRFQRMLDRKDDENLARQRIINDRIAFYDKHMKGVTFVVDSNDISIKDLGDKIYNLYHNMLLSVEK